MVASVGVGIMAERRWRLRREEVNDLMEAEEEELRRRRMVFGCVLQRMGTMGGMRERTGCREMMVGGAASFGGACSSTGLRVMAIFSRGRAGALPSIWERIVPWARREAERGAPEEERKWWWLNRRPFDL